VGATVSTYWLVPLHHRKQHVHPRCRPRSSPLSLAATTLTRRAPIHRAVDVGGRNFNNGSYIVAIHPNTVNHDNRGAWLNQVLSARGVTLDSDATQSLKLEWHKDIFNGIGGTFSAEALTALQEQPEVAWIQEGQALPSMHNLSR
jgi:hypothetical protein